MLDDQLHAARVYAVCVAGRGVRGRAVAALHHATSLLKRQCHRGQLGNHATHHSLAAQDTLDAYPSFNRTVAHSEFSYSEFVGLDVYLDMQDRMYFSAGAIDR